MPKAEIITIGNEILSGWTLNTNARWLAEKLNGIGLAIGWMTTIADTDDEITKALTAASVRADVIVCTGGLGPTPDDITKNTITRFFRTELVLDKETLTQVLKLFESRHITMPEINRQQAMVPAEARLMFNPIGTAPGLIFERDQTLFFFMPGVPREMKKMVSEQALGQISQFLKLPPIDTYVLRTTGIPESRLYEKLEPLLNNYPDIDLSFLPKVTGVDIKLKISRQPADRHQRAVQLLAGVKKIAQKYIYTDTESELSEIIGRLLSEKNFTLSIAESFTGGMISDRITNIPGCSDYFYGSVVSYSNQSKVKQLGVSEATLSQFGAVSEATAREMVIGVKKRFDTTCAIASTGIAGPGGATPEKPVGLCYLAATCHDNLIVKKFNFGHERFVNKERGSMAALELLRRLILKIK